MNKPQAEEAASTIVKNGWRNPRCDVAYCYTRGCYAVVVSANYDQVVLVDDEATRAYLENHTARIKAPSDGT